MDVSHETNFGMLTIYASTEDERLFLSRMVDALRYGNVVANTPSETCTFFAKSPGKPANHHLRVVGGKDGQE